MTLNYFFIDLFICLNAHIYSKTIKIFLFTNKYFIIIKLFIILNNLIY